MDTSVNYLLIALFSIPIHASDICLMLTSDEKAAITEALTRKKNQDIQTLHLDGIIYHHPLSWAIWLNGRIHTPEQVLPSVQVVKVTPEDVEMIWIPNPHQQHHIILKPNEIFRSDPLDSD